MIRNTGLGVRLQRAVGGEYFSGNRFAFGFFIFMTIVTIARSLIHILAPDGGAQSIATIPLDDFSRNGAAAVVHLFALWGLSQLIVGLLYLWALLQRRTLIPLLYLLAFVEYAVRLLLTFFKPMEISGTAPGAVGNYILLPLLALMFVLSILPQRS